VLSPTWRGDAFVLEPPSNGAQRMTGSTSSKRRRTVGMVSESTSKFVLSALYLNP
jgi:hypothetical protein